MVLLGLCRSFSMNAISAQMVSFANKTLQAAINLRHDESLSRNINDENCLVTVNSAAWSVLLQ